MTFKLCRNVQQDFIVQIVVNFQNHVHLDITQIQQEAQLVGFVRRVTAVKYLLISLLNAQVELTAHKGI